MKKIALFIVLALLLSGSVSANASPVSTGTYRHEQNKIYKNETKQIKKLFEVHNAFANRHDLQALKPLYYDNYINNDGFDKETYFKTVEETWEECKDLTYTYKIQSIEVNGIHATVRVSEKALGTVYDKVDNTPLSGEIHSVSSGIYHLIKINGKWLISGETMLTDESALLYGEARFMSIDLQAPDQVASGESYTTTVTVDADEDTVIIGSIEHDPVVYPSKVPNGPLRTMPKTNVLERFIKANSDNLNEYTVASLAISKAKADKFGGKQVYVAGLACLMKRINVVPKNNFIKREDKI